MAVTVITLYSMSTPVNHAIDGAYFVINGFSAALLGAGATALKCWTEGLTYMLGGFCIVMWIFTLEASGTVESQTGICALTTILCVFCWALTFGHQGRKYTLIVATSFSGSTTSVLGVDCFTQAGLKESWLYIWNLRNTLSPSFTSTYPIMRGIRAETVVTLVLCRWCT